MLTNALAGRILHRSNPAVIWKRGKVEGRKGLVVGVFETCSEQTSYKFTPEGNRFNNEIKGKINELMKNKGIRFGKAEVYHGLGPYYSVVVAGLGEDTVGYNEEEALHENREHVRWAAAVGLLMQHKQDCCSVDIDPMGCPEAAAEGAYLANWSYQDNKDPEDAEHPPELHMFGCPSDEMKGHWQRGSVLAEAQNTARALSDCPANIMTPKHFAEEAIKILCPVGVHVNIRNLKWIEEQKMFAFLNMAKGSCEPPYFLEMHYCGGGEGDKPVVLVGKGVTFDSGGLCLKKCAPNLLYKPEMGEYRAAMCGGAVVVGTLKALACLAIPINVVGLVPLFENMPSGSAVKPGDVLLTRKGRTVVVEDTDNEGRLACADALTYADYFQPCLDVPIGNFANGSRFSLGSGASPVFSSSQIVWNEMQKAGALTGDRVWRFPLWKQYAGRVKMRIHADLDNIGKDGPYGNSCLAAAFLREFVNDCDFLYIETAGTGLKTSGTYAPYLRKNSMTGRPVRTVAQFLANMACPLDTPSPCGQPC